MGQCCNLALSLHSATTVPRVTDIQITHNNCTLLTNHQKPAIAKEYLCQKRSDKKATQATIKDHFA